MAPMLYVLCGLPFAGKSTLAAALAERLRIPAVRLDVINHELGFGLDGAAILPHEWDRTYAEAYRRLSQHLASGQSAIFDHANFTRAERDRARALAREHGATTRVIHVPVSEAEARARLLANRARGQRYDVRDEDFALVVEHFEAPVGEPDAVRYGADAPLEEWIAQMLMAGAGR
jgi:predicted kinase